MSREREGGGGSGLMNRAWLGAESLREERGRKLTKVHQHVIPQYKPSAVPPAVGYSAHAYTSVAMLEGERGERARGARGCRGG